MKKVKYTTSEFGEYEDGVVINAYKVADDCGDSDKVLLYHPVSDDERRYACSSVELARWDVRSHTYRSLREETYINLNKADDKKFQVLMPKTKKAVKKGKKR